MVVEKTCEYDDIILKIRDDLEKLKNRKVPIMMKSLTKTDVLASNNINSSLFPSANNS